MIGHTHTLRVKGKQRTIAISEVINGVERFCYLVTLTQDHSGHEHKSDMWTRSIFDDKRRVAVMTYADTLLAPTHSHG